MHGIPHVCKVILKLYHIYIYIYIYIYKLLSQILFTYHLLSVIRCLMQSFSPYWFIDNPTWSSLDWKCFTTTGTRKEGEHFD